MDTLKETLRRLVRSVVKLPPDPGAAAWSVTSSEGQGRESEASQASSTVLRIRRR